MAAARSAHGPTEAALDDLVEREGEIALLAGLLAAAERGRGRVVAIEGEPGVGKSALAAGVGGLAVGRGCSLLTAQATQLEVGLAYGVVRQLFSGAVARRELAGPAMHSVPVLSADPVAAGGSAGADAFPVLNGLYWLQLELADAAPVVMIVDDVQWADAASVRWLHFLAERIADLRSLVLVTMRPRRPGPVAADSPYALGVRHAVESLRLAALSETGGTRLARTLLGDADEQLYRACHRLTGGNPFYLRSLAAAIADAGIGDARELESFAPESVTRSVLLRLGRLDASATAVIRATAILGGDADLRAVSAFTKLAPEQAAAGADALTAASLLEPGWPLRFVHPIVRSAVYADLLPGERSLAHARAARTLADHEVPDERIALQLLSSEPVGDAWAVERLRAAAHTARARGAIDSAIALLERALAEPPPPEALGTVLAELGGAERFAGRPTAAGHIEQALAGAAAGPPRAQLAIELAAAYEHAGRAADAVALLEQARAELGDDDAPLAAVIDTMIMVGCLTSLAPMSGGVRARATGTLHAVVDHALVARPLAGTLALVVLMTGGDATDVASFVEEAVRTPRPPAIFEHVGLYGALVAAGPAERFARVDELRGQAVTAARAAGSRWMLGVASTWSALHLLGAGSLDASELEARVGLDMLHDVPAGYVASGAILADVLLERGQREAAADVVADVERVAGDLPDTLQHMFFHSAAARVALSLGEAQEAVDHARTLEGLLQRGQFSAPALFPWRRDLALALHRLGDSASAQQLAYEHVTELRAFGAPGALADGLRALGLIVGGPKGLELLRGAVETAETSPRPLVVARAKLGLGAALRRHGHDRAAREILYAALSAAEGLGADAIADAAREELVAAGARPRAAPEERRHTLTPSEQRIARMAAKGATNRDIAQALFVTPKTVETHLRSVFRKLDITSRQHVAAALDGEPPGSAPPELSATDSSSRASATGAERS